MTDPYDFSQEPTISVNDARAGWHAFRPAGLHEDIDHHVNIYTAELTIERVEYGPRGDDEWARLGSQVIAAWPADQWRDVTRHDRRLP